MELNYAGKIYMVELVDDGTLDTVIRIDGKEHRFDQEYAANWRDDKGALSQEGLEELAKEVIDSEVDERTLRGGDETAEFDNPFELYQEKNYAEIAKKVTEELKKLIDSGKSFDEVVDVIDTNDEMRKVGAADTASLDAIYVYMKTKGSKAEKRYLKSKPMEGVVMKNLEKQAIDEGKVNLSEAVSLKLDPVQTFIAGSLIKWAVKQEPIKKESEKAGALFNWSNLGTEVYPKMLAAVKDGRGYSVEGPEVATVIAMLDWAIRQPEVVRQSSAPGSFFNITGIADGIIQSTKKIKPREEKPAEEPEVKAEDKPEFDPLVSGEKPKEEAAAGADEHDPDAMIGEAIKKNKKEKKSGVKTKIKKGKKIKEDREERGDVVSASFGPGRYYFGDICYIMKDDVYDNVWGKEHDYDPGQFDAEGVKFAVAGTAWGDGTYDGSDGKEYGVDAGVLGIVPESLWDEEKNGRADELGTVLDVKNSLSFKSEHGKFTVTADGKSFTVDTRDMSDEDEDNDHDENESKKLADKSKLSEATVAEWEAEAGKITPEEKKMYADAISTLLNWGMFKAEFGWTGLGALKAVLTGVQSQSGENPPAKGVESPAAAPNSKAVESVSETFDVGSTVILQKAIMEDGKVLIPVGAKISIEGWSETDRVVEVRHKGNSYNIAEREFLDSVGEGKMPTIGKDTPAEMMKKLMEKHGLLKVEEKKKYNLVGVDGNAFSIMGYVKNAMQNEGMDKAMVSDYIKDATSGDYQHLLAASQEIIEALNLNQGQMESKMPVIGKDSVPEMQKKLLEGVELRPFDESDWSGFAGAEKPDDNTEPLIGEVKVANWPEPDVAAEYDHTVMVIVDKRGIGLEGANGGYFKEVGFEEGKKIAAGMIAPVDASKLEAEGWTSINFPEKKSEVPAEEGKMPKIGKDTVPEMQKTLQEGVTSNLKKLMR